MHKRFSVGFTIVELMIVIVVIGIIVRITVVAYNGTQSRAKDTAVQDDLVKLGDALNLYYADNGSYPTDNVALGTITNMKFTKSNYMTSGNAVLYCATPSPNPGRWMVVIAKSVSGKVYDIQNDAQVEPYAYGTFPGASTTADCGNFLGTVPAPVGVWIHSTASGWMSNF